MTAATTVSAWRSCWPISRSRSDGTGYDQAPPGEFQEGSGGGVSTVFAEPGYQRAVVPTGLATSGGTAQAARVLPDISADVGNPWLIGRHGMEADAMQAAGHSFGFANPVLYRLGIRAIRDILPVDPADPPIALGAQEITTVDPTQLTTFGEDAPLTATAGYDDATGIDAPTTSFVGALGSTDAGIGRGGRLWLQSRRSVRPGRRTHGLSSSRSTSCLNHGRSRRPAG